uniref:3-hydroxyacyl-CoA dehydrogenase n=1 Tax=Echinostoma caproni TaxID=27848 RepID=A0A183AQY3_9TREM
LKIARHASTAHQHLSKLKTVAVIGSGLMGSGIAQTAVQYGYSVNLVDSNQSAITKATSKINKNLTRLGEKKFAENKSEAQKYVDSCMSNLHSFSDLEKAISQADLIIEAIVETMDAKHKLFRELDQRARADCYLASNTSSLSLKEISTVISRKERFGGLHFFNPVPVLKLVEVIRTSETSDDTFQVLTQFAASLDKTPVACRDTPGFIVNRLLIPYLIEAVALAERGDASLSDVDVSMKLGAGYPMGPFELSDFIGLDTVKLVMRCPPMLARLVAEGKLGRKTGEGFFKYDNPCWVYPTIDTAQQTVLFLDGTTGNGSDVLMFAHTSFDTHHIIHHDNVA